MLKTASLIDDHSELMFRRSRSLKINRTLKGFLKRIPTQLKNSGAYGSYYKYSRTHGLKVINEFKYESRYSFKYIVDLKGMTDIFREVALFNIFYGKELASVSIAFEYDKKRRVYFYYPAILMPHFNGRHSTDIKKLLYCKSKDSVVYARDKTKKTGLVPLSYAILQCGNKTGMFFHDIHEGNVIIDKNNSPWVIDFSSDFVQYFGNSKVLDRKISKIREKFRKRVIDDYKKTA